MSASAKTPTRPRRRGGRPTKLSPTLQTTICELVARGVPSEDAAVSVGISRRTFFKWLERGQAGEPLYAEFQLAIDEAFAVFHAATVGQAVADPKNAMAILEKRFPKAWGRQDRLAVDVSVTSRPWLDTSKYTVDELRLLRQLVAKGSPDASDIPRGGVPAVELLEAIIEGEVVSEEEVA